LVELLASRDWGYDMVMYVCGSSDENGNC